MLGLHGGVYLYIIVQTVHICLCFRYILLISKQAVDLANTTISNKTLSFKTEHQPTSTTHRLSWWAHLPDMIEQEKDVFQIQRFEANQNCRKTGRFF